MIIKYIWDPSKTEISKTGKIITNTNGIVHQKTNLKYTRDPPKTEADECNNSTTRKKHILHVSIMQYFYSKHHLCCHGNWVVCLHVEQFLNCWKHLLPLSHCDFYLHYLCLTLLSIAWGERWLFALEL